MPFKMFSKRQEDIDRHYIVFIEADRLKKVWHHHVNFIYSAIIWNSKHNAFAHVDICTYFENMSSAL